MFIHSFLSLYRRRLYALAEHIRATLSIECLLNDRVIVVRRNAIQMQCNLG